MRLRKIRSKADSPGTYTQLVSGITLLLERARRQTARAVNVVLTATYWEVGRRIVEWDQKGEERARYGERLRGMISGHLTSRLGRGFSPDNLELMRRFYLAFPHRRISETLSRKSGTSPFPLSWSHYVALLGLDDETARSFYETETLRGGWSVRQLDRQIGSQFYERMLLSKNKAATLSKGAIPQPQDRVTPEEEIKDPYVLEFLNLKDEYSESDLEETLIRHLETFLLELGVGFTFVGRQKRLRVGDAWYRVDLALFHRRLKCLVLIDLKLDRFTHADAGQMHLYLNYARKHWMFPGENPPVGLILCAQKDEAVAHYALEGLPNKVMASEYRTSLPGKAQLEAELRKTQKALQSFRRLKGPNA